ncbi:MAG: ATP-binding protein, partial [Alphaproteobacteria bacterium]|nr:ATP-binding protein [Alphaproteobacteria bacterium]
MLLRFRAGNHLSLREPQELSLVASSLKENDTGLIDCPAAGGKLVPAAIIYGANASGKSNVVAALDFMQRQVLYSQNRADPQAPIARRTFALDTRCALRPSKFEIDFLLDGGRFHYGFEATDAAFVSEWLLSYPSGKRTSLFSRKGQTFKFGRSLKGQNAVIAELTRPNSLFLSAAVQNNHEELSKVAGFFRRLHTDKVISVGARAASNKLKDTNLDDRVIAFLRRIGTGVVSYQKKVTDVPESAIKMQSALFESMRKSFELPMSDDLIDRKKTEIELAHESVDGTLVYFELDRESSGTRRLLMLLRQIYLTLDTGSVMVIDEFDASLHTQACEALLALFCSPKTNPKGAQLIATTHDTNLLRSPLIRRDQIWFTEKDEVGATHLYPLTDIATRQGDNIEKGYLQGRFGAVPFSG